ncbi:MAG: hypothetical protein HKM00_05780 [Gallionella sp.]|nr:hypothetical protein [Gallionella sp.]
MISIVPLLLEWTLLRRWFCWTDALSVSQRQAIEAVQLRRYYTIAFEDGYAARVKPYLKRILLVTCTAMAGGHGAELKMPLARRCPHVDVCHVVSNVRDAVDPRNVAI